MQEQQERNFAEMRHVTARTINSVAYEATQNFHCGKVAQLSKTQVKNALGCGWDEAETVHWVANKRFEI